MKWLLLLVLSLSFGCTTVNCSLQSGERNSVKSDQDQTPSTKIDAKLPLLK